MYNDPAIVESSLTVSCKGKIALYNSLASIYPTEVKTYTNIYSDFIQNCWSSEITHMSNSWWIHKLQSICTMEYYYWYMQQHNVDGSQRRYSKWEKPKDKEENTIWLHLYEKGKNTGRKIKSVVTRDWG